MYSNRTYFGSLLSTEPIIIQELQMLVSQMKKCFNIKIFYSPLNFYGILFMKFNKILF